MPYWHNTGTLSGHPTPVGQAATWSAGLHSHLIGIEMARVHSQNLQAIFVLGPTSDHFLQYRFQANSSSICHCLTVTNWEMLHSFIIDIYLPPLYAFSLLGLLQGAPPCTCHCPPSTTRLSLSEEHGSLSVASVNFTGERDRQN